jgi:hypothetical protein
MNYIINIYYSHSDKAVFTQKLIKIIYLTINIKVYDIFYNNQVLFKRT